MAEVVQNVLYLTSPDLYVARDHLTLRIEQNSQLKLSLPVHHIESVCVFGPAILSSGALQLCNENGVAINYLSENGYFLAQVRGIPDSSVTLRRAHFRAADDQLVCINVARNIIAGKIQNSRNSLLRAARESSIESEKKELESVIEQLGILIQKLPDCSDLDQLRGMEGIAAKNYFSVFTFILKQQRDDFTFILRSRRPALDNINCLLSYIYALIRHDCSAALTSIGLDPFVGFLHSERANRPALALDLMEEFRPWLADRLAITLINRKQISSKDFIKREGGAVEFTDTGRKSVIKAYQERKQEKLFHPMFEQKLRIAQLAFVQARILARVLRGDLDNYLPFIPK